MSNFKTRAEGCKYFAGDHPRVIAHRGASGIRPENTLPAFEQAVVDRADIIELDVHMTADGELVTLHDCDVDRTTDGSGNVHELTYGQLRSLDAGYSFTADGGVTHPFRGRGIYIPRLEEVLQRLPRVPLNIEIKDECSDLVERLVSMLNKYERFRDGSVLVVTKRGKMMRLLRKLAPEALTGHSRPESYRFLASAFFHLPFLAGDTTADVIQLPDRDGWFSLPISLMARSARNAGLEVHVWTVNDEARMNALLAAGVDGIFTDQPALLRRVIAKKAWRKAPNDK